MLWLLQLRATPWCHPRWALGRRKRGGAKGKRAPSCSMGTRSRALDPSPWPAPLRSRQEWLHSAGQAAHRRQAASLADPAPARPAQNQQPTQAAPAPLVGW